MRQLIWAVRGLACAALLAAWSPALAFQAAPGSLAPAAPHAAPAAIQRPAPGHFAGKPSLTPLVQLCRDKSGQGIAGTTCPTLRDGRQLWAISASASFAPSGPLAGDVVSLQKGAVTDLASIPRLVSNIYPPDGPWTRAALFHDLCYQTHGTFLWHGHANHIRGPPYVRGECDELFRQAMVALNVGAFQRVTIYEAVRVGGGRGWGH